MALEQDIAALAALPVFAVFEADALRILAFSAARRRIRAGDVLFRKGERADGGVLVLSGLAVCDPADDGGPSALEFGPGTLFGEMAMFAATERPATAIMREAGEIIALPRDLVTRVLDNHPASARAVRSFLETRMARLMGDLSTVGANLG